jgi:hypothetical protein
MKIGAFIFCTPSTEKAIRFLDLADVDVKSASEYEHGQPR